MFLWQNEQQMETWTNYSSTHCRKREGVMQLSEIWQETESGKKCPILQKQFSFAVKNRIYEENRSSTYYVQYLIIIWLRTSTTMLKTLRVNHQSVWNKKYSLLNGYAEDQKVCLKLEIPEEESQSLKNKTNRVNKNGRHMHGRFGFYNNNIAGLSANQRPAFSGWSVGHVTHNL